MKQLARWMMRLYPAQWRSRYGQEFEALIADSGADVRVIADLATGGIRMRFSTQSFPTFLLTMAIAGALLGLAASYLMTPQYLSRATVQIAPAKASSEVASSDVIRSLNEHVLEMTVNIVNRSTLKSIAAKLQLYPSASSSDELTEDMRRNVQIGFVALPSKLRGNTSAFEIQFTYPDAAKARQTATALMDAFLANSATTQGVVLRVLDRPTTPAQVKPNRRTMALAGGILGILIACLMALFHHRWAAPPNRVVLNG